MSLTAHQDKLIARIAAANPRTAVVLIAGSPVDMTAWIAKTPAVAAGVVRRLGGRPRDRRGRLRRRQPVGQAPLHVAEGACATPPPTSPAARAQYPGEAGKVWYDEGLLVGYRWNDTKAVEPLFAFGHGLGYTRFRYAALQSTLTEGPDGPSAALSLQVTNVGDRAGAEIVQAYVRPVKPPVMRPDKELKAFAKVMLAPGETKTVTLALAPRAFAYYAPDARAWRAAPGRYDLLIGASSRDIRLTGAVELTKSTLLR